MPKLGQSTPGLSSPTLISQQIIIPQRKLGSKVTRQEQLEAARLLALQKQQRQEIARQRQESIQSIESEYISPYLSQGKVVRQGNVIKVVGTRKATVGPGKFKQEPVTLVEVRYDPKTGKPTSVVMQSVHNRGRGGADEVFTTFKRTFTEEGTPARTIAHHVVGGYITGRTITDHTTGQSLTETDNDPIRSGSDSGTTYLDPSGRPVGVSKKLTEQQRKELEESGYKQITKKQYETTRRKLKTDPIFVVSVGGRKYITPSKTFADKKLKDYETSLILKAAPLFAKQGYDLFSTKEGIQLQRTERILLEEPIPSKAKKDKQTSMFEKEYLESFTKRTVALEKRQQTFYESEGFQRIRKIADIVTDPKSWGTDVYTPRAKKGIIGKGVSDALYASMAGPLLLGGFIPSTAEKILLTGEAAIYPETRPHIIPELKRAGTETLKIYTRPETYITAAILALPTAILGKPIIKAKTGMMGKTKVTIIKTPKFGRPKTYEYLTPSGKRAFVFVKGKGRITTTPKYTRVTAMDKAVSLVREGKLPKYELVPKFKEPALKEIPRVFKAPRILKSERILELKKGKAELYREITDKPQPTQFTVYGKPQKIPTRSYEPITTMKGKDVIVDILKPQPPITLQRIDVYGAVPKFVKIADTPFKFKEVGREIQTKFPSDIVSKTTARKIIVLDRSDKRIMALGEEDITIKGTGFLTDRQVFFKGREAEGFKVLGEVSPQASRFELVQSLKPKVRIEDITIQRKLIDIFKKKKKELSIKEFEKLTGKKIGDILKLPKEKIYKETISDKSLITKKKSVKSISKPTTGVFPPFTMNLLKGAIKVKPKFTRVEQRFGFKAPVFKGRQEADFIRGRADILKKEDMYIRIPKSARLGVRGAVKVARELKVKPIAIVSPDIRNEIMQIPMNIIKPDVRTKPDDMLDIMNIAKQNIIQRQLKIQRQTNIMRQMVMVKTRIIPKTPTTTIYEPEIPGPPPPPIITFDIPFPLAKPTRKKKKPKGKRKESLVYIAGFTSRALRIKRKGGTRGLAKEIRQRSFSPFEFRGLLK